MKIGKFKNYDFSNYLISDYGDIKNTKTKRLLKGTQKNLDSYIITKLKDLLTNKLITIYVHILVAWKFVPGSDLTKEVNHKDKNKQNNHFTNLEWLTPKEHAVHTSGKKVYKIDEKTHNITCYYDSITEAAKDSGVTVKYIRLSAQHKIGAVRGYFWEYIEEFGSID